MGVIDVFVIPIVNILTDFNSPNILVEHLLDYIHYVSNLHFDYENEASAMTWLEIGAIKGKKVRKVRDNGTQIGFRIVIFPPLTERRSLAPLGFVGGYEVQNVEASRQQQSICFIFDTISCAQRITRYFGDMLIN